MPKKIEQLSQNAWTEEDDRKLKELNRKLYAVNEEKRAKRQVIERVKYQEKIKPKKEAKKYDEKFIQENTKQVLSKLSNNQIELDKIPLSEKTAYVKQLYKQVKLEERREKRRQTYKAKRMKQNETNASNTTIDEMKYQENPVDEVSRGSSTKLSYDSLFT